MTRLAALVVAPLATWAAWGISGVITDGVTRLPTTLCVMVVPVIVGFILVGLLDAYRPATLTPVRATEHLALTPTALAGPTVTATVTDLPPVRWEIEAAP